MIKRNREKERTLARKYRKKNSGMKKDTWIKKGRKQLKKSIEKEIQNERRNYGVIRISGRSECH
jgi:hypothetical protein